MPHRRRTDHVNRRDLEVLAFLARFGVVSRSTLAAWSASGRSVAYARERRLELAGLLATGRAPEGERFLTATRAGLRACGHGELPPARPSLATLRHDLLLARLGARLEREGSAVRSEREILAAERIDGERRHSAALPNGRFHRPDLLRLEGKQVEAIELELSVKGARRLDAILRAWRFAVAEGRLARVVYHCPPRTRGPVERAIGRTATAAMVEVVELRL